MSRAPGRQRPLGAPLLAIGPSLLFLAILFTWPVIVGIGQSFSGDHGPTLTYLRQMVDEAYFWTAVRNTLLLVVAVLPVQFLLALAMALMLRSRPKLAGFYLYIWVLPLAISDLAAGLVWLSILSDRGYLNSALQWLHLPTFSWLSYQHPVTVFLAVAIAEVWRATSLVFVIVIAGLQGIPRDYDEAAEVFGATYWQRLWHVILPQLRPSLQVAFILRTILAFQTFAVAQALTGQNFPLLVGEAYRFYGMLQDPHVASALALVVLAISLLTSVAYLRLLRSRTPEPVA